MKMPIDKEWFEKRATAEGDHEIGVGGNRKTMTLNLTDEEIAQLQKLIDDHRGVIIPAPRGGMDPNWWEEWVKTTRAYNALAKAAQAVIDETKAIHDNEPWPLRYRAPYDAITKLSLALASADASIAVTPSPSTREPTSTQEQEGSE